MSQLPEYDAPEPKYILVIDDERRFRVLEGRENTEVIYARNIADAEEYLITRNNLHWDEVWLDHDMGAGDGGDVMVLLNEIERAVALGYLDLNVDLFVIHTQNPVRRIDMNRLLLNLGYTVRNEYDIKRWL